MAQGVGRPFPAVARRGLHTLQVNITYRCNQACVHCHVDAGPKRFDALSPEGMALVLAVLAHQRSQVLDLTGGAPEMHTGFRALVRGARAAGVRVLDRCNLTILSEPGQESLAAFLAAEGVEIIASLPCYLGENVDRQRGQGIFARSMVGLQALNALGYGIPGSGLTLSLVFNPQGATLPPAQEALEADYRQHLAKEWGVSFTRLFALCNMPINRYLHTLEREGALAAYLALLAGAHRPENLERIMCREGVSVDPYGRLYDCDFNQQLGLPIRDPGGRPCTLEDLLAMDLTGLPITVGAHCYGCTAGQGSGCGGALSGPAVLPGPVEGGA
jgi:radical SAM/Cys-rich protein